MRRFTIDGRRVESFGDFVAATNDGLIRLAGGEWDGNLDALVDYLAWPPDAEYELEILGSSKCQESLGHQAMASWLRDNLNRCHPTAIPGVKARLAAAERGDGQTLFGLLREIILEAKRVTLVLH